MTTFAIDTPDTLAGATSTTVVTVVVSAESVQGLRPLVESVLAQSVPSDLIVVLDRTGDGSAGPLVAEVVDGKPSFEGRVRVMTGSTDIGTRAAITALVADGDVLPEDALVWLLPAGVVPQWDALGLLLAAYRSSTAVVAVGPKLLDAGDPTLLRSVGIQATAAGRLVEDPPPGTRDQRQFDTRRDVLAIPLAGALMRVDSLRTLKGWEPTFGDVAADLDIGWRLHLAGGRVELVPAALVRAAAGVGRATADTATQRRAARRVALVRAAWWTAPFLALWIAGGAVLSGLALLLLKRPRAAAAEFGDILALDPVRWILVKVRRPSRVTVGRRHLTALFVPAAELRRRVTDQVSDALFPAQEPERDADRDGDRTSTMVGVLTNPGLVATVATSVVAAVAARSLGSGAWSGLRGGLAGGELTGGRGDSAALWSAWADTWTGAGLGHAGSGSPALALLGMATWLLEHVPGTRTLASTMGATATLILILTPPAACVSAYLSARVLTAHRWLRAAAALTWATIGAAGPAYAAGRLGALVALVLVPLVLAGLALLARPDGTATAAWATALGLTVLTAFAPLVAAPLLGLAVVLTIAAPAPGTRLRALTPVLAVPVLTVLWWPALLADWRPLLAGSGLAAWDAPEVDAWRLALLDTGEVASAQVWFAGPLVAMGILGLLRGRALRSLATAVALLGVAGLGVALVSQRILLAPVPAALGDGSITPWTGAGVLVLTAALVAAAVHGLDLLAVPDGPISLEASSRWAALAPGLRTISAFGIAAAAAVGLALATLGTLLVPWSDSRPAVAIEHAQGSLAGRTLVVTATVIGPGFRLMGRETDGPTRTLPSALSDPATQTEVATPVRTSDTVSRLLEGTAPDTSAEALRGLAVGFVMLEAGLGDDITRRLDATSGLTRLAPRGGWEIWRVTPVASQTQTPIGPPRVTVTGPAGARVVEVLGQSAATAVDIQAEPGEVLRISEGAGWVTKATVRLDGVVLAASADHTYELPGSGRLEIDVRRGPAWLGPVQLAGLIALIFLAIPFGSRASRTRRPTR